MGSYSCADAEGFGKATVLRPGDPNEKLGIGEIDQVSGQVINNDVAPGQEMTYTIYFENMGLAAVQEVYIADSLPDTLDPATFRLGEIAFGDTVVSDFIGKEAGYVRVVIGDLWLDIRAERQPGSTEVDWFFTTLDPLTEDLPSGTDQGFLCAADPGVPDAHCTEGHVTFTIQQIPGLADITEIRNEATIVFDTEAPVDTNTWVNIVRNGNERPVVTGLLLTGTSPTVLTWDPFPGADSYDVIRGSVASIQSSSGGVNLGSVKCLAADTSGIAFSDPEVPVPGECFFYLVRPTLSGKNGAYGYASEGEEVPSAGDCP